MGKQKFIFGIGLVSLILSVGLLSGCISQGTDVKMFFCNSIEIKLTKVAVGSDDYITITFFKQGNYSICFYPDEFNEKNCCSSCNCPRIYNITDNEIDCCNGYSITLHKYNLRSRLEVTVYLEGSCECFTFNE